MTADATSCHDEDGGTRRDDAYMDERVTLPLDPETALRALLKVDPNAPPADEGESQDETGPGAH